jgi:hypothetical protein
MVGVTLADISHKEAKLHRGRAAPIGSLLLTLSSRVF